MAEVGVYVIAEPILGKEEGELVQLTEDKAQALVDAGIIREATQEDVGEAPEEEEEEAADETAPMDQEPEMVESLTRAMKKVAEEAAVKATEVAVKKVSTKTNRKPDLSGRIFAQPKDNTNGFKNFGEWCRCLGAAHRGDWAAQRKLFQFQSKGPSGMNEGTSAQGGYAVIPEWADQIWDKVRSMFSLKDMTDKYSVSGDQLNLPYLNETSRADGSRFGGIQSYYIAEGNTFTGSYPQLGQVSLVLNTLGAFVYLSNQLLADNAFNLDRYVTEKVALEFLFKTNDGIVNGTGSSQPTGILNQPALITVASSSSHGTVTFPDIVNMYNRLYFASKPNAIWIMNQEVEAQLIQMTFPNSSGTFPAFTGISYNAHDEFPLRIFGRPAYVVEQCSQLGLAGDIIACDLSQLYMIEKGTGNLEVDVSTEFHFNQYETVYRFVYRWDVKSPWPSALSPYHGSQTFSPFVCLASRGS